MDYRFLGESGLRISTLGLGTMTFGGTGSRFFEGVGGVDQTVANRMVDLALDHGINFFDTADVYSRGLSEEMLGNALRERREKCLIATKMHGRMSDEVNDVGQSRHHILNSCNASLRRLGTDYIDLYQLHNFDAYARWEESLTALNDLVRWGKVRYIGCSNLTAWQLMKALSVANRLNLTPFTSYQGNYSLIAREAEDELLPACADQGLGYLVWSPLAGGYLTGKYAAQAEMTGRRHKVGDPGTIDATRGEHILKTVTDIAAGRGVPTCQVALNYLRANQNVSSILIGSRNLQQLEDNLGCMEWSLTQEEVGALDAATATPLRYPYWHQRQYNTARFEKAK